MAAMTMDREPEVARFIDTYKFDQEMSTRRDRFGGGTSLPLHSDGYEDKQQALRDERHRDWMVQQDKQKQMEQEKFENRHRSPPRPAHPQGPQIDYNQSGEQARAEEKRAYQDYMKAKEERYWQMRGRPVTPPGGLNIGNYDRQLKETAAAKKKEYKEMLDQQQKEHMYLRARQEPEISVMDRNAPAQHLANKPPPGPGYSRSRDENETEKRRHDERNHLHQSKPAEVVKNQYYSSDDYEKFQKEIQRKQGEEYREFLSKGFQPPPGRVGLPLGQYKYEPKRLTLEAERNTEYNNLLKELPDGKNKGMTPKATNLSLPVGQYDLIRPVFEVERNKEYNELIHTGRIGQRSSRDHPPTPEHQQGLPIGQQHYQHVQKAMESQRNREYNDFLQKKYGKHTSRSTRSEPDRDRAKTSFYYGNDNFHDEKRKMLDDERKNEYHKFVKELEPARSRSIDIPTDVDSGLPIGQQHHEAWKKFLRKQRNQEYNQLVDMKAGETRKRDWNFDNNGVLELHGDDAVQSKQRELRAERQKEYNSYISQLKTPPNHSWPEPPGRGALLVRKGEYDNVRQMYDQQRKREFVDTMQKRREMGLDLPPSTAPPEPLRRSYEYNNPMIHVLGRYEDFRRKLVDDRKKDFKSYMDKVKDNDASRHLLISTAPNLAREETPLIHSMGVYEKETKQKVSLERKKDFKDFNIEQQKHWTPRTMVKENLMPHVASAETPLVNYMGQYDQEQLKFRAERNKELRSYTEKRKKELRNPYDNYVYPTVAVAEKPIVAYMGSEVDQRKRNLREERKRDYEQHKAQQKGKNPDRRHEFVDTASGPYGGLFQGLGDHGNRSEVLNKERQREYNEQYAGKEKITGRPNWARDTLPNSTDRGRSSPMKSQPPTDQYQQLLDEKRREEASRRRYDDPEYQGRLAESRERERGGEAGQRYGGY